MQNGRQRNFSKETGKDLHDFEVKKNKKFSPLKKKKYNTSILLQKHLSTLKEIKTFYIKSEDWGYLGGEGAAVTWEGAGMDGGGLFLAGGPPGVLSL